MCLCACWVENRVHSWPSLVAASLWGKWTFPFTVNHFVFLYLSVCFLFICFLSVLIAVPGWDINHLKRSERQWEVDVKDTITVFQCRTVQPRWHGSQYGTLKLGVVVLGALAKWSHGECIFVLTGCWSCNHCEGRSHGQTQGGRPKL